MRARGGKYVGYEFSFAYDEFEVSVGYPNGDVEMRTRYR